MADIHTTENEFGKGVTYAAPIDLNAKKPLDSRVYVDTLAQRDGHFTHHRCYPGMQVYVGDTGLTYIYDGEREVTGSDNEPIWLVLADRNWVSQQINMAGGLTPADVASIVESILEEKASHGELDDIREYIYGPLSVYTLEHNPEREGDEAYFYHNAVSGNTYVWREVNGHYEYTEPVASDYTKYFPSVGISGIQYVDKHQNLEYRWDETLNDYIQANTIADTSDITRLFDD